MPARPISYNELIKYKWRYYPMGIMKTMDKFDFIKFTNDLIYKQEKDEEGWRVSVTTTGIDIIVIDKKGNWSLEKYNHIFKGDRVNVTYNNKSYTFNKLKNKIDMIIFLNDFWYHENVRSYWSEEGFKYNEESVKLLDKLKTDIITNIKNDFMKIAL